MNLSVLVSGLSDVQYNGYYAFSGIVNGYPYYVKSGVAKIEATPDGMWALQDIFSGNHFVSNGSGFSYPWEVLSWEDQGIDPSGLVFTEVATDPVSARNNKYATATELGANRFRRLLALGYV